MAELSDVQVKVLRQVEYYFSDDSFPFDEYLKGKCDADGYVKLEVVMAFAKMKSYTTDVEVVKGALAQSDAVVVHEDGTSLKRLYPTPDVDPEKAQTVHVAGFSTMPTAEPMERNIAESMKKYGKVAKVRALRNLAQDSRMLDGSAFVTFKEAKSVAAAVACTGAVIGGRKIVIHSLDDWFQRQSKKRDAMKKKKEQKEEDKKNGVVRSCNTERKPQEVVLGCVLKFDALDTCTEDCSREALRAACEVDDIKVRYVEFERGQATGFVRLDGAKAKELYDKLATDGKTKLAGADVPVSVLEGDDEQSYWARAAESAKAARGKRKGGGRGGFRKKQRN